MFCFAKIPLCLYRMNVFFSCFYNVLPLDSWVNPKEEEGIVFSTLFLPWPLLVSEFQSCCHCFVCACLCLEHISPGLLPRKLSLTRVLVGSPFISSHYTLCFYVHTLIMLYIVQLVLKVWSLGSISITWTFVRNTDFQALIISPESETLRWGPQICAV